MSEFKFGDKVIIQKENGLVATFCGEQECIFLREDNDFKAVVIFENADVLVRVELADLHFSKPKDTHTHIKRITKDVVYQCDNYAKLSFIVDKINKLIDKVNEFDEALYSVNEFDKQLCSIDRVAEE